MGIEGGSNSEVQNQEINQANNEQNEINQAEHQRSGEELEGNSTIDNEGERKQIEGKDDATESAEDESSQLDKEDNIEDDPNTEQPPESDNVAPEQQLDNQDTIESDPSGADEMGEDNNETVDSLDNDDEIEDAEDLDDNQDSTEGDIQDSLDAEDSIDSDDTDDSVEEDDNNEQDPLDSEDSIEDDSEESESPEGEEDIENPENNEELENSEGEGDTENLEDGEESENPEGEEDTENPEDGEESESPEGEEDTENPEDGEESESPEGEEDTENPEDGEESENPEGEEDTENPEDGEESENPEGEESENPKDGEESESPEGEEDTENPEDGEESENPEGEEDTENPEDNEESENSEGGEDSEDPKGNNGPEMPEDFVTKDANESNESDNDSVKGEVSDELKNALEPFEQSNWDNMSPEQQKEAVSELRDSVADDLGLQEKPTVKYYNNDDDTDFGGYSPSENAIYINEHNMGDAKETADTIAHESRHCWQHEIADNSDNPQAQAFKENFDDYIRPEDDYRGYRNQPVEADAREYAKNITDHIPDKKTIGDEKVDGAPSEANATSNDIRQNQEEKGAVFDGKAEIPSDLESKTGEIESKIKEPDRYASKFEYDTQQKLENYYKEEGGNLSDSQKQDLVSDLKNSYDSADTSDRGDILVPEDSKDVTSVYYNGKTGKYDIGYDWKTVDTVPETRTMEVMKEGQQFDRVGPPSGRCTGAVGEDGSCATVKERSIPYHFTEEDITKEPSYHRYQAEQDFTKENLTNAIDNSMMYSDDKKVEMHTNVDRYYENAQVKGYGDGDGLATGEIAPMFEDTTGATGGGKQYDMPLSMEELENIGMISEVEKGTY
jgi:hypothetical protein